jgi:hypothetical protein
MIAFKRQLIKNACVVFGIVNTWFALLPSCKNRPTREQMLHAYENRMGIRPSKLAQIDTINFTRIEWINPTWNFGTVKEGDSVIVKFRCRNTGNNPLFLSKIYSPCGCTVSYYTEKVILPGVEDELPVYFNTVGQEKSVRKNIIVTSNTSNGVRHTLYLEGQITSGGKPPAK